MKNFIKIFKIICFIYISYFLNVSYAHKKEFQNLQIFGDSLSDTGSYNKVAIADKDNNFLYPTYLANIFTVKDIRPFYNNNNDILGTDHSSIGLTALYSETNDILQIAINQFINLQSLGKNNSKNLYIIWVGGNDLVQTSTYHIIGLSDIVFQAVSHDITYQIQRLYNVNAKYIMVANIFNPAISPLMVKNHLITSPVIDSIYATLLQGIVSPILELSRIFISDFTNINNFIDKLNRQIVLLEGGLLSKTDKNLRREDLSFVGEGNNQEILFDKVNQRSHFKILDKLFKKILRLQNQVVIGFNNQLEQSLKSLNKDVIYIDIYHLYEDIRANAKAYGIDDIIMPQCSLGMLSYEVNDICKRGSKYFNDDKIYMFSDQIHPSGFMHKIFSQYMESIFNAPVRVSAITRQLVSLNTHSQDNIFNQLINHKPNLDNKITSFISFSENANKIGNPFNYNSKTSYMSILNLGLLKDINDNITLGTAINASLGNYKPYEHFKYKFDSQILYFFAQLINDNWILSSNLSLGRIGINHIKRTIPLGLGQHIETANTKGNLIALNLNLAKQFIINQNLTLSPILKLYLDKYHVNAFQEHNYKSTSLKYHNSNFKDKNISIGLRTNYNNNHINYYSQFDIIQPINANPIKIRSGLKSTALTFNREIAAYNKRYLNLSTGFIKNNFNTFANLKLDHNKNFNYSLSVIFKF